MVSDIIVANGLVGGSYAEPFAGGAGLALSLLFEDVVREIHLNDIDPAIAALWRAVLDQTDDLIEVLQETPITIDEWHRQREIYNQGTDNDDVTFGFSTLFLNRTNRSGIIKGAGVIGGMRQNGNYLLDCRFNKTDLAKRIFRVSKYKNRIHFSQHDAIDFLQHMRKELPVRSLVCADPPYYGKGSALYTSFYEPHDHAELAASVLEIDGPWITTYDNCEQISDLYQSRRQYEFSVQYSAQTKRLGSELLIVSKGLRIGSHLPLKLSHRPR